MSTITSPRPLPSNLSTPSSSRRPSLDSSVTSPSHNPLNLLPPRRNRAALRDYYGLKNAAPVGANNGAQQGDIVGERDGKDGGESELDGEGFDAEVYVRGVLGREGLGGLLRIEGALIGEIKGLDGERKALVYDNYSKLITATDTIRKMRTNMDPLTPTTSTLSPTISHIAETASSLATSLRERSSRATHPDKADTEKRMKPQQETVRWVLAMPGRLRRLLEGGKREEAVRDWEAVEGLLGKWEERGVGGAREVREECEGILERGVGRLAVGVDV